MCHPRTWHWRPLKGYKSLEKNQGWRESAIGLLDRFVHVVNTCLENTMAKRGVSLPDQSST
jgi:hypothetical protein